ncbi:hypothetical protein DERP_001716 [Dermatophagoides pteronyssinus]|uniref:Uncharacterized protein n=1 Tax=Dermatophagoides pteronyssinus TaxID=6956 RepID=A0ABQ8JBV6_DERPT|nr:hypothetical protein DERP_001716 [Dermatophagoides pteronyssinus]
MPEIVGTCGIGIDGNPFGIPDIGEKPFGIPAIDGNPFIIPGIDGLNGGLGYCGNCGICGIFGNCCCIGDIGLKNPFVGCLIGGGRIGCDIIDGNIGGSPGGIGAGGPIVLSANIC